MRIHWVEVSSRSNPKLNPKVNPYEELKKYKNDPNVYISFTYEDKIGINPRADYETPLGIYAYPLKQIFQDNELESWTISAIPYAGDRPYIWVIKVRPGANFIHDMKTSYKLDNFKADAQKLKSFYLELKENGKEKKLSCLRAIKNEKKVFDSVDEDYDYLIERYSKEYKSIAFAFWSFVESLAEALTGEDSGIKKITKWNTLLRFCGYDGFADKSGKAFIHEGEPIQAIFLTAKAFTVITKIKNVANHQDPPKLVKSPVDLIELLKTEDECLDLDGYEKGRSLKMLLHYILGVTSAQPFGIKFVGNKQKFLSQLTVSQLSILSKKLVSKGLTGSLWKEILVDLKEKGTL
jgi:hypothetical protein